MISRLVAWSLCNISSCTLVTLFMRKAFHSEPFSNRSWDWRQSLDTASIASNAMVSVEDQAKAFLESAIASKYNILFKNRRITTSSWAIANFSNRSLATL
uniref:Uncharacterized protein n=1 Tax=Pelagomonas calceolata TaxID=35677 RepID=A0A6S8WGK9_9STRA